MIDYDSLLDKRLAEEQLRSPDTVHQAYRHALENPGFLAGLTGDQAICFYAISCFAQDTDPKWFEGTEGKPNNGFLEYLIEINPDLKTDEDARAKARKAAISFTKQDMMRITRRESDPLSYAKASLNGNHGTNGNGYNNGNKNKRPGPANQATKYLFDKGETFTS